MAKDLAGRMNFSRVPGQAQPPNPRPHRISLDLTALEYRALKQAAIDEGRPLQHILRDLVAEWMTPRGRDPRTTTP